MVNNQEENFQKNLRLARINDAENQQIKEEKERSENINRRAPSRNPNEKRTFKRLLKLGSLSRGLEKKALDKTKAQWAIAKAIAISSDIVDFIPIIGWIFPWFSRPYLISFLWGKGTLKNRIIYRVIVFLDFIPVINYFPFSTWSVFHAHKKAREELEKIKKTSKKYQEAQANFNARAYADDYEKQSYLKAA